MLSVTIKFERVFGMLEFNKELEFKEVGFSESSDWEVVRRFVVFLKKFYILINSVFSFLSVICNLILLILILFLRY